ncbi:hypothetical protein AT6N2_C0863 [Agrobacterium tumefaciens]|nr:hypothetical protein AT6N2_C0863 [Agrobacterium tumefaciens]
MSHWKSCLVLSGREQRHDRELFLKSEHHADDGLQPSSNGPRIFSIEMNAIHRRRARHGTRIEKAAIELVGQIPVNGGQHRRFIDRIAKDRAHKRVGRLAQRRRRDDQHVGRLPVRDLPDMVAREFHQPFDTLHGDNCRSMDRWFQVVGAEHDNHQIKRRMAVQQRRKNPRAVAVAIGGVIVISGSATAQPFVDHMHIRTERLLQDARPKIVMAVPATRFRI